MLFAHVGDFPRFFEFVALQHSHEIMGFSNGEQIKSQRDSRHGSWTKNLGTLSLFFRYYHQLQPLVKRRNIKKHWEKHMHVHCHQVKPKGCLCFVLQLLNSVLEEITRQEAGKNSSFTATWILCCTQVKREVWLFMLLFTNAAQVQEWVKFHFHLCL